MNIKKQAAVDEAYSKLKECLHLAQLLSQYFEGIQNVIQAQTPSEPVKEKKVKDKDVK